MFSTIWHSVFFDPIYNGLIFLIDIVPGGDVGIAIILLTIIVKAILLPVSLSAARTQRVMRDVEPKLAEIKERTKDDREALARETLAAYRDAGVSPFSSIFLLFIQIPIVIALYLSVYTGGGVRLPDINVGILYSFIPNPENASMLFLGLIDIAAKSLPLAVLAGVTQFFQAHVSFPAPAPKVEGAKPSFKEDFARSMQLQVKYVMPVIIFFFAYTISASVALYFVVSNLLGIAQEYIVRRTHLHATDSTPSA
jgi:YidC/Oxa1 family membrane protein insertase